MEERAMEKKVVLEELDQREAELKEREQTVEKKERELSMMEASIVGAKYNLYERVNVSLGTMNVVVGGIAVVLVVTLLVAIFT